MWVAGCATGEEVYSLAMVVREVLGDKLDDGRVQIFGTDVSEAAVGFRAAGLVCRVDRRRRLARAAAAVLREDRRRLPGAKALRDMCVFARQDLTRDPPFSHLDLICCRNVLIYMDSALQRKLLSMFHYALKPQGVLVLGHAESIGYHSELFTLMNKKHKIYRKKPAATAAPHMDVFRPAVQSRRRSRRRRRAPQRDEARAERRDPHHHGAVRAAERAARSALSRRAVQRPDRPVSRALARRAELRFLKLAREGLSHGLRTALQTARKTRKTVRQPGLRVRQRHGIAGHRHRRDSGRPAGPPVLPGAVPDADAGRQARKHRKPARREKKAAPRSRIGKLEEELAATREYLQSTIQEIEAANEELQSANEEILSSNEELQSTNEELDTAKEELQSTNEELNTVNDELHARNEELTRVNADLLNLLASVQIAIVIVARDLRVRRFTPMAEKKFNLIPSDIGRPLSQISTTLQCPELPSLITETIDTVSPVERTVQDDKGETYLLRIRPYKTPDNRIDGAVVALFDLDPAKK